MLFEFDNNTPIYVQLVEQLRLEIISGQMGCGERLPSVRDLALAARVNPNTMQKALLELEEQGLIYTQRTNGKFVTEDEGLIARLKEQHACEITQNYLNMMKSLGIGQEGAMEYLASIGGTEK